jgi:CheY-like chemotaxis protein
MGADQTTKLLLVDDQPANLAVLEAILSDVDAGLVAVTSGEAALREVLAHEFAVVLLDVRMPGMSGFELAQLIRDHPRTRALPIIFLTAGDPDEWPIDQAYALGAVDYLTKPINPIILRAKVAVFIDLYRKGVELAGALRERHQAQLRSRDERLRLILPFGDAAPRTSRGGARTKCWGRASTCCSRPRTAPTARPRAKRRAHSNMAARSTGAGTCGATASGSSPTA